MNGPPQTNRVGLHAQPMESGFAPIAAPPVALCLLVAVVIFVVFWPVLSCDFVSFDDPSYVTSNSHVQNGLTREGLLWAFRTSHMGSWHPLTWISHMLDVQLFALRPGAHHFINLLFHIVNTLLLFLLLKRLTVAPWRSAFVAILFALHPLHVESVAWVAERKDVLSGCFFLLTLLAYVDYVNRSRITHRTARFSYFATLALFTLGLMSKPMLVTLPFVLLLLDYWPLRRMQLPAANFRTLLARNRFLVTEKIPFIALCAAASIITFLTQKTAGAMQPLSALPASARIENALVSYVQYLGKTFWPVNLATPYSYAGHWPVYQVVSSALFLCLLCAAAVGFRRKSPFLPTGWFWFLGMLVPVIGLVQVGAQSMADRYTYLPLIGIFIIVAWGVAEIIKRWRIPPVVGGSLVGLLLLPLGARTRDQLRYWRNSESLFAHAVFVTKNNYVALYNLGWQQEMAGRVDQAITNYQRALELEPNSPEALNNMGHALAGRRQYAQAVPYFEAAIRAKPKLFEPRHNLGRALSELGRIDEAIEQYQLALQVDPDHAGVLDNLGNALARKGQFAQAIPYYEASLRAKPSQASTHYDLANAWVRVRNVGQAIPHYQAAIQYNTNYAGAHHDLGILMANQRNFPEAITQLREAVRCKPDDAGFRASLGKALAATQQFDEAVDSFRESLRLAPTNPVFHFQFARVLAAQGKASEAIQHCNEALRLKPDFAEAQKELEALRSSTPK